MTTEEEWLPDGPLDQVLRETMLRFANPKDRAALVRVAWMLFSHVVEHRTDKEPGIRPALRAASQDVRNLQGYLAETVGVYQGDEEEGRSGRKLVAAASVYGRKLGRIADSIEAELGTPPSQALDDRYPGE